MKTVTFSKQSARFLRRTPVNVATLILSKINQYAEDPRSLGNNVTRLQGREGFRLRVGDWRVIFDDDGMVLAILEIGPRGGVYN